MNLSSGHYFSSQGSGGELWALIEAGVTERQMVDFLLLRYGLDDVSARTGVTSFLEQLREYELVQATADLPTPAGPVEAAATPYAAPLLNVYSDMQDLLLLDPIHDVSEAGWPMPKPADS